MPGPVAGSPPPRKRSHADLAVPAARLVSPLSQLLSFVRAGGSEIEHTENIVAGGVARRPRPHRAGRGKDPEDRGRDGRAGDAPLGRRAPRWGHGHGPSRRLASTGSTKL